MDPTVGLEGDSRDHRVSSSPLSSGLLVLEEMADPEPDELDPAQSRGAVERLCRDVGLCRGIGKHKAVDGEAGRRNCDHGSARKAERVRERKLGHAGADAFSTARTR
jgi:hypothetical protein